MGSKIGRATGGPIPETTGVDTVPAMLSGGEFVMNSGAADRIGKGNLERMNSGLDSNSSESDEKLISKLDELIVVTKDSTGEINITINEGGSEGQGQEQEETSGGSSQSKNRMAKKMKEEVLKIIKEEKRLGGSLRNDKL